MNNHNSRPALWLWGKTMEARRTLRPASRMKTSLVLSDEDERGTSLARTTREPFTCTWPKMRGKREATGQLPGGDIRAISCLPTCRRRVR